MGDCLSLKFPEEGFYDVKIVDILGKNATIHKLEENEVIEADLCIWCRLYFDSKRLFNQIRAKKNILWVHSKPRERENCILDNLEAMNKFDKIVCVSEAIKNEVGVDNKTVVIHNFLDDSIVSLADEGNPFDGFGDDCLKLVIVARISDGKGFDKVLDFVKCMKGNGNRFVLKIIGKGRRKEEEIKASFSGIDEVEFVRI